MATINDIGIPEIGSGILQPKLQHKFRATFQGLGGSTDAQPVSLQVINVSRMKLNFAEVELHRYNSRGYVPGKHEFEPLNLVVEDDILGTASQIIQDQIQRQQFLIGGEGPWLASAGEGSELKFVTVIDQLDGNETVVEKVVYEGCWIREIDYGENDASTSEALKMNLTIRFDHAHQHIGGYDGFGVAVGGTGIVN
jgi:hypothetical protein